MAKFLTAGCSIEAANAYVASRKSPPTPVRKDMGKKVGVLYKYACKRHTLVQNTQELDPKEPIVCLTSSLNLEDTLEGGSVDVFSRKLISMSVVSNFSHVHGIQASNANCFVYAKIAIPFRLAAEGRLTAAALPPSPKISALKEGN